MIEKRVVYLISILQLIFLLLFIIFARYGGTEKYSASIYARVLFSRKPLLIHSGIAVLCPEIFCHLQIFTLLPAFLSNMICVKSCIQKLFYQQINDHNDKLRNNRIQPIRRCKIALLLMGFQWFLFILFIIFAKYDLQADASEFRNSVTPVLGGLCQNSDQLYKHYNLFQDVHVMILVGFGFLMTFLKKYGYSAVGFNFLLSAVVVQWSVLCQGLLDLDDNHKIQISIVSILEADIAAAAVLISMGAVLGKTSHAQLIIMGIIEIMVYTGNQYFGKNILKVTDAGGSIFVHTFGAYFGLAVSFVLFRKKEDLENNSYLEGSNYVSDLFSMIGTIFLWMFWPSFNAIELTGDDQHRAIINTYYALTASCVTAFAISAMLSPEHKFNMIHVQNSTLAGGVAVGAAANLMLQPYGALIVGVMAGSISVYGYNVITPWMKSKLKIHDTCGVHNLHGLPGILAGVVGVIMAAIASYDTYRYSLYEIYPARADSVKKYNLDNLSINPGDDRSALTQAVFQALALAVTVVIAIISGLITGRIMMLDKEFLAFQHNDDGEFWELPIDLNSGKNFEEGKDGPVFVFKPYIRSDASTT